jgi:hypothetical protein
VHNGAEKQKETRVDSDCCTVFSVPEIPKATETHDRSRFTVNACGEYGIGSTACRLIALSHACETGDRTRRSHRTYSTCAVRDRPCFEALLYRYSR